MDKAIMDDTFYLLLFIGVLWGKQADKRSSLQE
jgi:hypothetical protein